MSKARKCDRCRKLFEPSVTYKGVKECNYGVAVDLISINQRTMEREMRIDLCNSCYESYLNWLELKEQSK